jgi:hypothetical protein
MAHQGLIFNVVVFLAIDGHQNEERLPRSVAVNPCGFLMTREKSWPYLFIINHDYLLETQILFSIALKINNSA